MTGGSTATAVVPSAQDTLKYLRAHMDDVNAAIAKTSGDIALQQQFIVAEQKTLADLRSDQAQLGALIDYYSKLPGPR